MAKIQHITTTDPVVAAHRAMNAAGENDAAYEMAKDRFIAAEPITRRGLLLKLELRRDFMASLSDGDAITESGIAFLINLDKQLKAARNRIAHEAHVVH